MRLRVPANASDEEIQPALHQLFNQSVKCPQGNSVLSSQSPQGSIVSTTEDQAPIQDSFEVNPVVIAPLQFRKCSWIILFEILCILY